MTNQFKRITVNAAMPSATVIAAIQAEIVIINTALGTVVSIQEYLNSEMNNVVITIAYNTP